MLLARVSGAALIVAGTLLAALAQSREASLPLAGRVAFTDRSKPPPWTAVHAAARREYDLGQAIFSSTWQPAGHADATANEGLGPLFIERSCNACHENGARGRPPASPGELSQSFVMQLAGAESAYGHVLNTRAIEGHVPEGRITVAQHTRRGRYPDGQTWTLTEPRYAVQDLASGPLAGTVVLKPRIGPAVFGAGLLDAVPQDAVDAIRASQPRRVRGTTGGRFGWQANAISLVDQTAIAFAREMGLTSQFMPEDDCAAAQKACRDAAAGKPELQERLFHAVNSFQFLLAVPARGRIDPEREAAGAQLFDRVGCADCHVPSLPVPRETDSIRIDPYTDLLLHDLGDGLADRTVAGKVVTSRWRTAPLWGLAHAIQTGPVALLHDGRAGSVEEAILWHEGQGNAARRRFMALDASSRKLLLDWVASL
jgi:CxxC motif-containing protein (DUF1111 family)